MFVRQDLAEMQNWRISEVHKAYTLYLSFAEIIWGISFVYHRHWFLLLYHMYDMFENKYTQVIYNAILNAW